MTWLKTIKCNSINKNKIEATRKMNTKEKDNKVTLYFMMVSK